MTQDITYALRLFCRRPVLFGVSVAGLAVAISISAAVWSIARGVTFAGSGVRAPESVLRVALAGGVLTPVTGDSPMQGNWAYADYLRLEEAVSTLDLVASTVSTATISLGRDTASLESVRVMAVSDRYFSALGFQAALGRTLLPSDARPGLSPLVVSRGFWKNRFSADPSIVGRTVWLDDRPYTVVGVADRAHFVSDGGGVPPAFWTTFAAREAVWTGSVRWNPAVEVFGRLRTGRTSAQAATEVRAVTTAVAHERRADNVRSTVRLEPLDEKPPGSMAMAAGLMTIMGLVVLLACANIANVLLANAAVRRREIATRLAMGAGRGRVIRQLLTESVLLGMLGAALAFIAARPLTSPLAALLQVPAAYDVGLDLSAAVFVALLGLTTGVLAGVAPARYGWRRDLVLPLQAAPIAAQGAFGNSRLRSLLVGGQAAISVVLLVAAALLTRAVVRSAQMSPGYDVGSLVNVSIGYDPGARPSAPHADPAFWDAAVDRVRGLPDVEAAALALVVPFGDGSASEVVEGRRVHRNETSPDYFRTVGLRVLGGRVYSADDVRTGAPVAVISAALAQDVWHGKDPIGATLTAVWGPDTVNSGKLGGLMRRPAGTRVIGVVSDGRMHLADRSERAIYLPLADPSAARLVVRARGNPRALLGPIREALQPLDPRLRVSSALAADGWQREIERPQLLAALASVVGAIALALAAIGLFGVTAFVVEQRFHEMGVRRALGATHAALLGLLLRQSLRPVGIGGACGVAASLAAAPLMQDVLNGTSGRDPAAIAAAVFVLLAASACAVLVPARRAASVNPAQLLRLG